MKYTIYVYWEGVKNIDNINILKSKENPELDSELKQHIATICKKQITSNTKFFTLIGK